VSTIEKRDGLYIVLVSVHGLIRGHDLELGRDADTGGQTKYVVELARALAQRPEVDRVELLTRMIIDPKVDPGYARQTEEIAPGARIVRLPFGPRRYLRKEVLWPHLDSMADHALKHIRSVGRVPDIIHSHYADAGYVGSRLACLLGVPLIHTGHSLGREKLRRLLDRGAKPHTLEKQYNISRRIEAEELAMDSASLVIASTRQEVVQQYSLYDNYHPKRMQVIPPGTDLSRFHPPEPGEQPPIAGELERFLHAPDKPMVLALSRADERKNIGTLIRAYGENEALQERANLVVVAGNRDDIASLDKGAQRVLTDMLRLIDKYDLYGRVAYPKHHSASDVPTLYRLAAASGGLFVNPALTEPFGLTLIEAAATGLPMVATEDGGPRDIHKHCRNGLLIDPLDSEGMGTALLEALSDRDRWQRWAQSGVEGAHRHYSWDSHVESYVKSVQAILGNRHRARLLQPAKSRLPTLRRLVISDIDDTLIGDDEALAALVTRLQEAGESVGFGVATGRNLESTLAALKEKGIAMPDVMITSTGTEIHYGNRMVRDEAWARHIDYRWDRRRLLAALAEVPGLKMQPDHAQSQHKISFFIDSDRAPTIRELVRHLRALDLHANVIYSYQAYLDVVPIRASKGQAIRYLGARWGIEPEAMLVAGNSGNDIDMLRGNTLGVVTGNYSCELERLRGEPLIYFAQGHHTWGVLEGIDYYDFLTLDRERGLKAYGENERDTGKLPA
jgi:sucrose-phosphate synthase